MAKVSKRRRRIGTDESGAPIYGPVEGWQVRYVDPDGAEHRRVFGSKGEADRFAVEVEHRKLTGSYVDPTAGRVTFRDYAEAWRTAQAHRPGTAEQLESRLRLHVYPAIGHRPIGAIRPTELKALIRDRERALAASTVENIAGWIGTILNAAVDDRIIASSPVRKGTLDVTSSTSKKPIRLLEVDELEAVALELPARWRAMVGLAAGTGLRSGEVLGLAVDRVDFLRRSLLVDQQLQTVTGSGPTLGPPKTAASHRTIPLPDVVLELLAAHLAAFAPGPDGLVFTTSTGTPIRRNRFGSAWSKAIARAGLPAGVGFHALRHTYASLLIGAGCSVKVVQARLGHATAQETLDTYSHLWPDDEDRTRAAIDDALGARSDQRRTDAAIER